MAQSTEHSALRERLQQKEVEVSALTNLIHKQGRSLHLAEHPARGEGSNGQAEGNLHRRIGGEARDGASSRIINFRAPYIAWSDCVCV